MERQRFQPVRKITAGKHPIQGSIGACRCAGMRHCMAAKTGEVMPPATAPRISRPHRHTAVLPMDGSERRCQRLQETFRRTASCRRADHGKSCRHFALVSRGHRSDRTPPRESPRHFAASMDESVIVGYYTLKKCLSAAPRCLQILRKGQKIYGKK